MSKRLLDEEAAVLKVELSLKLCGKEFRTSFLRCGECRFHWGNIANGRPRNLVINPLSGQLGYHPKYRWYCFCYSRFPYHAKLGFRTIRRNSEGVIVPIRGFFNEKTQHWSNDPQEGETDATELVRGNCSARVCRRFESTSR